MTIDMTREKHQAGVEDILLAILGFVSGPLLWWMGQSWKSQPAASSLHTLEYWIALICGFIGAALAALWLVFLIAGMTYIIGLRTRHAAVTYWAELFTPKFLRRILMSVLGAQLALSSQAVAAPESGDTQTEAPSAAEQEVFMPYVAIPSDTDQVTTENQLQYHSSSPVPEQSDVMPSIATSTPSPTASAVTPVPRKTSQVVVSPETSSATTNEAQLVPTPRQTSTIHVETQTPSPMASEDDQSDTYQSGTYTPPPVPVTPHLMTQPPNTDTTQSETFVIKTGDCLWDIAHYELGADATLFQIDHRWRQWWEYNYQLLGDDPHTIQPGTILEIPPFTD